MNGGSSPSGSLLIAIITEREFPFPNPTSTPLPSLFTLEHQQDWFDADITPVRLDPGGVSDRRALQELPRHQPLGPAQQAAGGRDADPGVTAGLFVRRKPPYGLDSYTAISCQHRNAPITPGGAPSEAHPFAAHSRIWSAFGSPLNKGTVLLLIPIPIPCNAPHLRAPPHPLRRAYLHPHHGVTHHHRRRHDQCDRVAVPLHALAGGRRCQRCELQGALSGGRRLWPGRRDADPVVLCGTPSESNNCT